MATNGNARSASYDADDENDAMELVNSLREDVEDIKMYRKGGKCAVVGAACSGNIFSSGYLACCGSGNLYCDRTALFRRALGGGDTLVGSIGGSLSSIGYGLGSGTCRCKDGTVANRDGTDCQPPSCLNTNDRCDTRDGPRYAGTAPPCCNGFCYLRGDGIGACQPYSGVGGTCGIYGSPFKAPNYGCVNGLICWSSDLICHAPPAPPLGVDGSYCGNAYTGKLYTAGCNKGNTCSTYDFKCHPTGANVLATGAPPPLPAAGSCSGEYGPCGDGANLGCCNGFTCALSDLKCRTKGK